MLQLTRTTDAKVTVDIANEWIQQDLAMQRITTSPKARRPDNRRPNLQRSGINLQAIIDSVDDELIVIDRDLCVTQVNEAVLKRHGIKRSEAIGQPCYRISHGLSEPCRPPACECPVAVVWESGKSVRLSHIHDYNIGDQTEKRHVDIIASPVKDGQGNIVEVVEVMRDVTEARRLEQQIMETNQNLLALNDIASTVNQSMDLETVLNTALDKVLELLKGNTGGILLLDKKSQTLSYRAYRGLSEEFVEGVAGLKLGEGIAGRVAQLGKPIYVDDISKDPRLTREVVIKEGLRAFASVPLQSKKKVLGVMNIASHTAGPFGHPDIQLLISVANQVAIAIENAELYNEVQRKEEMRGELLRQIISTQEDERKRIARGLHDETSQALTGLAVNLQVVMDALPLDVDQVKVKLRRIQNMAINTLDEIHRVIYELRPSLLDDLGLVAAVNWHAENYLEAAGVKVHLETIGVERRLSAEVETALFRIIQEASTNIVRHAGANSASITIDFKHASVAICIKDNGKGFDLDKVMRSKDKGYGLGLLGMKERVEFLNGSLSIQSRPTCGTEIAAEIPIEWEITDGQDKSVDSR